ncbi:MAG TPA: Gfo/Idh/MocA family oxidoreductase [Longilinea sp.]|nr:Gfo/Idh/MocA family oxidoreductase [Longilinea sp.]
MTIRFAISGAGFIAKTHAKAIQALADAKLIAVVERHADHATAFAGQYGIAKTYPDVPSLLRDGSVDALIVATPNALHMSQTIAALEVGVAVMVEKPMAMNAAEAEAMLEASQRSKAALMVAHHWRFDEEIDWLKVQVDSGRLGHIIRTKSYGVHTNWGPAGWFTQKTLAGGGAIADVGIHALDTTRYLMGDPQPVSVYARISRNFIGGDVDDTAVVIVNWDNSATSYIESGWWQPHVDLPFAGTQLYGSRGFGMTFPTRLELPDPQTHKVDVIDPGFQFPREPHVPQSIYDRQMKAFAEAITNGTGPMPGGLEGLTNMKVIDAAYESAQTGKAIDIR